MRNSGREVEPRLDREVEAKKVCLDFTIAAIRAFTPSTAMAANEKFQSVHLSSAAAEKNQSITVDYAGLSMYWKR